MAADTRETGTSAAKAGFAPHKQTQKGGVILGEDGKPCRPCMSFSAFSKQSKASLQTGQSGRAGSAATPAAATMATAAAAAAATGPPVECPADVETLGRSTWTLLHSVAAQYPTKPTAGQQADVKGFVGILSRLYPCWVCAEDFHAYLQQTPVQVGSRDEFGRWLCAAHNEVNRKLGKPEFDCNLWEERWRTGWKDGRCD